MRNELFWISLLVVVALGVAFMNRRRNIRTRSRRHQLILNSQIISLEDLKDRAAPDTSLIATDFGFGAEYWYIPNNDENVDLSRKVYAQGLLIVPSPKFNQMKTFCNQHGIKMRIVGRKS